MKQQPAKVTQQAIENATDNYAEWSEFQAYKNALRKGQVQFVVHVHKGNIRHTHVHYDGGKVPNWGE